MKTVETLDLAARSRSGQKKKEAHADDTIEENPVDTSAKESTDLFSSRSITMDDGANTNGGFFSTFHGFLFPKIAPVPWFTFVVLTFFAAIPTLGYIILFTKMGSGKTTFYFLAQNFRGYDVTLGILLGSFAFILYLFDVHHWTSPLGVTLRSFFVGTIFVGVAALVIIMSEDYPYGPISLFIVLMPLYLAVVQQVFYSGTNPRTFIHWLSGPLFVVAIITFLSWFVWTFLRDENEWNLMISLAEAKDSGCEANFDDYPDCEDNGNTCFEVDLDDYTLVFHNNCDESCTQVYDHCINTFIIWVGPFLVSLGLLFLSFFASFLRGDGSPEQETSKFVRVWLFLLFAMWVTASLAGVGAGVSTTLTALVAASFVAGVVFLTIAYNSEERQERMDNMKQALLEKYGGFMDVFRGLLIVTCTPLFMVYFVISFIIQRIRSLTFLAYSKPPSNTPSLRDITGNGWFTIEARRMIRQFKSWNITKVFTCAIYWGLAYMVMNVIVSQYTLVFLSWLIEKTSHMNLATVTVILVMVGMTMFLLPPVPGVPIYLTLGIVIIPVGREIFGIVLSIIYALAVSLALKLLACTLQQKLIGGMLQHSVSVRQFVGVNSPLIRSMKLVLAEPGMGLAKVSILVGGPDWPTSVLCGIMDLPLAPILFGTLPIIFLIIPTLLTGSFIYLADLRDENGQPEFAWASTLGTVFAAVTAFVQFGSMVVAAYFLEQVVSNRADELEAIPIDEEVRIADEKDEERKNAYHEVSRWETLPILAKIIMLLSLTCMITTCYMVQLFSSHCFVEYQLTYTIDMHLVGDWRNLVKPLGVVSNYLLLASVVFLQMFTCWANRTAAKQVVSRTAIVPENGSTNYELQEI
mmetsp:Transcript_27450/g.32013  ORF Transcript_27450/g.32013 Transcript_27450/m.32013 type:complete len:861 (-) Transcript_27450:1289-3871(-)